MEPSVEGGDPRRDDSGALGRGGVQVRDKGWGCGRGRGSRPLCREGPHRWSLPPALRTGSKFTGPAAVRWGRPRAAQYINIFNE